MKLLNCTTCHDFVSLRASWRRCACGRSAARYLRDGESAEVSGDGRVFGLDGNLYRMSLDDRRMSLMVYPKEEDGLRVRRVKKGP